MKTKTNIKAGGLPMSNHNETIVRDTNQARGLKVKTNVKAGGGLLANHNETLVRDNAS
jgi:hypothetical protein